MSTRPLRLPSIVLVLSLLAMALLAACNGGKPDPATARPEPPGAAPAGALTLEVSSRTVAEGSPVTLTWNSTGADTCAASGAWAGSRPASGTETTEPLMATSRFDLACQGAGGAIRSAVTVDVLPRAAMTRFPLRMGDRYLVDANGQPFFIHGDAAWSLLVQLDPEGVETYLSDRRARGFNTLLVNLIEHRFSKQAPANVFGQPPFLKAGDFSTPNDEYFAYADRVLARAEELGFAVLLVPAYLGYDGGEEGWYRELLANSDEALEGYGRYVATRLRNRRNIIWTYGGDYDPPEKRTVLSIVRGIRTIQPDSIGTAHNAPFTSPAAFWSGEPWLTLNSVYTTEPVWDAALSEYQRRDAKPFFFIEGVYENERGAPLKRVRTQAWHALLAGAVGHVFGNSPIWHFSAPTASFKQSVSWREALGQPGSISMMHLLDVFRSVRWWTLEPDAANEFLIGGMGSGDQRAVAAVANDGSVALAYLPEPRTIQVDLRRLAGPTVTATWIEAATGVRTAAAGSPFPADALQSLTPPQGASGQQSPNWVLLLESAAAARM